MTKQKQVKQTKKKDTDKQQLLKLLIILLFIFNPSSCIDLQQQNKISYINFIVATIASYKA